MEKGIKTRNRINSYFVKTLKGSTMVEVLMAILVCLIIFSLSLSILLNIEKNHNTRLKLKADLLYELTNNDNTPSISETRITNGLNVRTTYTPYNDSRELYIKSVVISTKSGKRLSEKHLLTKTLDEEIFIQ
nr:hypothetical protein [uncultured Draconibacterium sp.]